MSLRCYFLRKSQRRAAVVAGLVELELRARIGLHQDSLRAQVRHLEKKNTAVVQVVPAYLTLQALRMKILGQLVELAALGQLVRTIGDPPEVEKDQAKPVNIEAFRPVIVQLRTAGGLARMLVLSLLRLAFLKELNTNCPVQLGHIQENSCILTGPWTPSSSLSVLASGYLTRFLDMALNGHRPSEATVTS